MKNSLFVEMRKKAGYEKQENLAKVLRLDCTTIGKWETGGSVPKLKTIPQLAKVLGVEIESIVNVFVAQGE